MTWFLLDIYVFFFDFQTLQCPDCDLKFPMKAVLKFHQDSAHQVILYWYFTYLHGYTLWYEVSKDFCHKKAGPLEPFLH